MKTRQSETDATTTMNGKQHSFVIPVTKCLGPRTAFAYARARGRHAALHDRAPRAAVHTRIGIVSHPHHRDPSRWPAIRSRMEHVLSEHGGRGGEAVSLLAAPTDRLFASVARQLGMRLSLVIPCRNFQNFFATPDDLSEYLYLRALANSQTVLDHPIFNREAFEDAAKLVVDTCDLLVAVGSGKAPTNHGGTGSIVHYASERGKLLVWIDPEAPSLSRRLYAVR